MVHALGAARSLKGAVLVLGPCLAPAVQHGRVVPFADLRAEAGRRHAPHGQHDMGVGVAVVALPVGRVNVQVGHHAKRDKLVAHEAAHEFGPLRVGQFVRQVQQDLAAKLGVLALLAALDRVPKLGTVVQRGGRGGGGHDFGKQGGGLAGVVERLAGALVLKAGGGAVGGGVDRAAPAASPDHLRLEPVCRHAPLAC